MTIPNILTLSRILLTPLLMWFLVNRQLNQALVVFFVAGMTDGLDGLIARLFDQRSRFGAILDPLADKLLLVSSFLVLGYLGLIPIWLVIIAVARDIVIVLGTSALFVLQFKVEIRPTALGKLTTLMQLLSVLLALSSELISMGGWSKTLVFAITAIFSLATGVQYVKKGISVGRSRSQLSQGRIEP
jgi:cardiolipin synthase (CMP-forming)